MTLDAQKALERHRHLIDLLAPLGFYPVDNKCGRFGHELLTECSFDFSTCSNEGIILDILRALKDADSRSGTGRFLVHRRAQRRASPDAVSPREYVDC
jgi:hypothetical protein